MGNFVPDDSADSAVVDGIIGFHVKERGLQYGGREYDFIHGRAVVSIHCLRCHEPLFSVYRLAQTCHHALIFTAIGAAHIADQIIGVYPQTVIVTPLIGIGNFGVQTRQFGLRLFFGGLGHPGQLINGDLK